MKYLALSMALLVTAFSVFASGSIKGVWYSEEDGLILTFASEDSIYVSSTTEETMKGEGTFAQTDTTLSATIENEELVIEMSYNYRWEDEKTIKAQALYFKINGEDISVPSEWVTMVRCDEQEDKDGSREE